MSPIVADGIALLSASPATRKCARVGAQFPDSIHFELPGMTVKKAGNDWCDSDQVVVHRVAAFKAADQVHPIHRFPLCCTQTFGIYMVISSFKPFGGEKTQSTH